MNGIKYLQVVICAGCNQFRFWGALVTGFISYFSYLAVHKLVLKMKSKNILFVELQLQITIFSF